MIRKTSSPIYISYYTKETLYEKDAQELKRTFEKFHLPHSIVGIDSFGSWDAHCCFKPAFILQKLKEFKQPVVWIDADAAVLQSPQLLNTLECDLAVRIDPERGPLDPSYLLTGTMYVNHSKSALFLMKEWLEVCQEALRTKPPGHEVWDQICLKALLARGTKATVQALPASYCAIFDVKEEEAPVIVHYQASRLYKKMINGEVGLDLGHLSIQELRNLRPTLQDS